MKRAFADFDRELAASQEDRHALCQLLAGLLSRQAILRALLDGSASPSSSSAETGVSNAQKMESK